MRILRNLVLTALAGAGCGTLPSPDLFARDDVKQLVATRGETLPYRVAVAGLAPRATVSAGPAGDKGWQTPLAAETARDDVAGSLKRFALFRDVNILEGLPADADAAAAVKQADRQGMDLVVCVTPGSQVVERKGVNGNFYLSAPLFFLFWWPGWLIADEDYSMSCTYRVAVHDARSGRELWATDIDQTFTHELTDLQDGWNFLYDISIGWFLCHTDEIALQKVGNTLAVHARNAAAAKFLAEMSGTFAGAVRGGAYDAQLKASGPRGFGVVVGVNRYAADPAYVPALQFAEADAQAFWAWAGANAGLTRETGTLLLGRDATRERILAGLRDIVSRRPRASDRVFLYFAGYGSLEPALSRDAKAPSDPMLLPHDFNLATGMSRPSSIGLAELGTLLAGLEAPVTVILDCGFATEYGSRTLGLPEGKGNPGAWPASLAGTKTLAVLLAGGLTGVAAESDTDRMGLFTRKLLDGLGGAADTDGNGFLTVREAAEYARREVEDMAALSGVTQQPALQGGEAGFGLVPGKDPPAPPAEVPPAADPPAADPPAGDPPAGGGGGL